MVLLGLATVQLRVSTLLQLGMLLSVGELLVVDWAPSEREGGKILFVLDGGALAEDQLAGIRVDDVEIDRYAYHHRTERDSLLIPRLARRVHVAIEAKSKGETVYLEHGVRLGNG
jgi:8-oxo-dGTP diphosphatase